MFIHCTLGCGDPGSVVKNRVAVSAVKSLLPVDNVKIVYYTENNFFHKQLLQ